MLATYRRGISLEHMKCCRGKLGTSEPHQEIVTYQETASTFDFKVILLKGTFYVPFMIDRRRIHYRYDQHLIHKMNNRCVALKWVLLAPYKHPL